MYEQIINGMFTNSNSSNGSNSDDDGKYRLSTLDFIYSDDNKQESFVFKQQQKLIPFQFYDTIRNDDDDLRMEKTG